MKDLKSRIQQFFFPDNGKGRLKPKDKLILLILGGILLLVVVWPVSDTQENHDLTDPEKLTVDQTQEVSDTYEVRLEEKLTRILEQIDGAGKVQVMLTLKDSGEHVVEKDRTTVENNSTDEDSSGKKSEQSSKDNSEVTVYSKGSESAPYVVKELQPEVEGVLVVAEGAGDDRVVNEITYAVQVLFDIPVHKIKVAKMSSR